MSNYNSTHTGAEIDEAIGRVIDGGSIKVQTDTNTADITSLKGRMTTAEGTLTVTSEQLSEIAVAVPYDKNQDNVEVTWGQYIKYSDGSISTGASVVNGTATIKNVGYRHVWVKSDFHDGAGAVISFYNGPTFGTGYLKNASVQGYLVVYGEFEADVPSDCTYIGVTVRKESNARPPLFTLYADEDLTLINQKRDLEAQKRDLEAKSDVSIKEEQKISGYDNLKPYLRWNGTTRIINNGNIPFAEGNYVDIALTSTGNIYQCAVAVYAGATKLYDSSWKKAVHYEAVDPTITHFTVWFKTSTNSTLSADTIDDIGNYVTNFEYTSTVLSTIGSTRSADYIDEAIGEIHDDINAIQVGTKPKNRVVNVAHQGYSTNGQRYGGSRASSVIGAAEYGFDYAEIDIQFSSDGVPFGSHNDYVEIDGENVPFSTLTWAEISVMPYQGEHYSSLDELVYTAKMHGVGLMLDKTPSSTIIWTDANWDAVFAVLDKYRFIKVIWILGTASSYSKVFGYNKYAHCNYFSNLSSPSTYRDLYLSRKDNYPFGTFSFSVNITGATVALLEAWNATVPSECPLFIYTVDDLTKWDMAFPYVSGITSDDYSEYIIQNQ